MFHQECGRIKVAFRTTEQRHTSHLTPHTPHGIHHNDLQRQTTTLQSFEAEARTEPSPLHAHAHTSSACCAVITRVSLSAEDGVCQQQRRRRRRRRRLQQGCSKAAKCTCSNILNVSIGTTSSSPPSSSNSDTGAEYTPPADVIITTEIRLYLERGVD
jgi:hypothetical protein